MVEHKPLTLRRNFSWTLVGNVIYTACQWAMLVVLAKLGSPEMVGQFALGLAITAPVMMFSNLSLRSVQATDVEHEYLFGQYLSLRLTTTILALMVITGIVFIVGYRWETALLILTIGVAKGFESLSDICYGLLQQHEQMNRIAKSMITKGSLSLVALGAGVYFTGSILWGAAGLVVAWVLVLVSYDIFSTASVLRASLSSGNVKLKKGLRAVTLLQPRWNTRALGRLTWLTLPLGFSALLVSLNANIPRYFVERYLGERELGIFAAMAYLIVAGNTVMIALGQSAMPRLARYYAAGNDTAFRALLLKLVGVGACGGGMSILVALVAGREVLTLLYSPEYSAYVNVFGWVMVSAAFGYVGTVLGHAVFATRLFSRLTIAYTLTTVIAIGASALFIPSFGLVGAAWALCATSLASIAMPLIILNSRRRQA